MKIFVCLVTPDERLRTYFGRGKSSVIPPDALTRGVFAHQLIRLTVASWTPDAPFSSGDFESFLLLRGRDYEACILLVDTAWQNYVSNVRNACFNVFFDAAAARENPHNFFAGLSARGLRSLGGILAKFRRGDDGKLLALPLRNFQATELLEIARLCQEQPLLNSFSTDVEQHLSELRKRVRPRRKSNYKTTYAVDDAGRFYAYGLEMHAHFATGEPHHPYCEVAALYRFGVRLNERRHFNVSETEGDRTRIEGSFPDCHGSVHAITGRTHLNMFTNDYF